MAKPISSILIVGGGSSGWIAATYLNRFLDPARCRITVVESESLSTIGVGEATVPPLAGFLRLMGINEDEFIRECHATYKLGIKFIDWGCARPLSGDEHAIWHPFGHVGAPLIEGVPLFHHWLKNHRAGRDASSYTSYSLQALLGEMGRAPRSLHDASIVMQQGGYAYHLDARAFAAFLAKLATQRGVRRLFDEVLESVRDEKGHIRHLVTRTNGNLTADFYIDCSGFAGLLIEKGLGDPHLSWSKQLFCDRAVVLAQPGSGKMPPYTRATALAAGWAWEIPLAHRIGHGYVYSSHFTSQDEATAELIARTGQNPDQCNPTHLKMQVGRRQNFWVGNCLAIGLSAGFLEPLESTGIFLIQKGVELLLDHFPNTDCHDALRRRYNSRMGAEFEAVRDFILLHYLLNRREDTEFWRANRATIPPDSLAGTLEYFDQTGIVEWQGNSLFRDPSFYSIVTGFGRLPRTHHPMADQVDENRVAQMLGRIKAQNLAVAQSLPEHRKLIETLNALPTRKAG